VRQWHALSNATFYKWRAKFGSMDVSLMAKMNELEDENKCLKKMHVDAQMRAMIVEEALAKKIGRPSQRREMAKAAVCQEFTRLARQGTNRRIHSLGLPP
jgi:putative transposase